MSILRRERTSRSSHNPRYASASAGSQVRNTKRSVVNWFANAFTPRPYAARDGYLYASAGDGASFNNVDYGQYGATYPGGKANPCGDPPGAVGTALTPPGAQGGALRSQSVRRPTGPATLDGAILRIDPATGAGVPGNPFFSSADPNARRIVSYGVRNPFRMTQRPGTDELWIGDVGWSAYKEINRVVAPTTATNFGWPCYEGAGPQSGYQGAGLTSCQSLYSTPGAVVAPYYAYHHNACVVSDPGCRTGGSSITGIAFYHSGSYPSQYNGALFFADHSRNEIWAMLPGTNGLPDPARLQSFVGVDAAGGAAGHPVDLKTGPGGDLFYVDVENGSVHRITFTAANQAPTAAFTANPASGAVPLTVNFDGSSSSDPEARSLTYSWDLNGDGTFGDATGTTTSYTYTSSGTYHPALRVTDDQGASDTTSVTVTVGNSAPTAVIDSPAASLTWKVGDAITFTGHATDVQDGTLPASSLRWVLNTHHCITPTDCHAHALQTFNGVASGSFTTPDHQYPSWIELALTATDSAGLTSTTSLRLNPRTVVLTFKTTPGGLNLTNLVVNEAPRSTPFSVTVIVGSANSVSAPSPQSFNKSTYFFTSWSDGGPQSHTITAPTINTTYRKR